MITALICVAFLVVGYLVGVGAKFSFKKLPAYVNESRKLREYRIRATHRFEDDPLETRVMRLRGEHQLLALQYQPSRGSTSWLETLEEDFARLESLNHDYQELCRSREPVFAYQARALRREFSALIEDLDSALSAVDKETELLKQEIENQDPKAKRIKAEKTLNEFKTELSAIAEQLSLMSSRGYLVSIPSEQLTALTNDVEEISKSKSDITDTIIASLNQRKERLVFAVDTADRQISQITSQVSRLPALRKSVLDAGFSEKRQQAALDLFNESKSGIKRAMSNSKSIEVDDLLRIVRKYIDKLDRYLRH